MNTMIYLIIAFAFVGITIFVAIHLFEVMQRGAEIKELQNRISEQTDKDDDDGNGA